MQTYLLRLQGRLGLSAVKHQRGVELAVGACDVEALDEAEGGPCGGRCRGSDNAEGKHDTR